jgi:lipopolysaccharide/colanic/teichoic acid biosynthesis glycosyltransferase
MSLPGNKSASRAATVQDDAIPVIGLDEWTKRIFDIIVATIGLVLFAPILLLAAMAISLDSGGPIFIREAPLDRNNRAIRFNPRPTGVGQILSQTGIDELPQLINVLLGEMSIVGRRNVRRWPTSVLAVAKIVSRAQNP